MSGTESRVLVEPHRREDRPWRQRTRGGTAEDRRLDHVEVWLPPSIAAARFEVPGRALAAMETAIAAISALDAEHLTSLATLLLRAESVASSKIEAIEASVDDYARALHGNRSNPSATSMVASTRALADLIGSVDSGHLIGLDAILNAHRLLMAEDPQERAYAGRVRDMQNWIGGSHHSPRGALYVPPPPQTVEGYLVDLVRFANREDLPVLLQAGVVHAQFESIHPFTDGNGRIGRALVNTVLRRRGVTRSVVVPLASALVARRDDYFAALGSYRDGDAGPLVVAFAGASQIAAQEARVSAARIATLPEMWRNRAGRPRAGSAAARILAGLAANPVLAAEDVELRIGGSTSSVYAAIDRLVDAGVLRPLTDRRRHQVWGAVDLLAELDDLGVRIAGRARAEL